MKFPFLTLFIASALLSYSPCSLIAIEPEMEFVQPNRYFKEYEEPEFRCFVENQDYAKFLLLVDLIDAASDPIEKKLLQAQLKTEILADLNYYTIQISEFKESLIEAQEDLAGVIQEREKRQLEKQEREKEAATAVKQNGILTLLQDATDAMIAGLDRMLDSLTNLRLESAQRSIFYSQENLTALQLYQETLLDLLNHTR